MKIAKTKFSLHEVRRTCRTSPAKMKNARRRAPVKFNQMSGEEVKCPAKLKKTSCTLQILRKFRCCIVNFIQGKCIIFVPQLQFTSTQFLDSSFQHCLEMIKIEPKPWGSCRKVSRTKRCLWRIQQARKPSRRPSMSTILYRHLCPHSQLLSICSGKKITTLIL